MILVAVAFASIAVAASPDIQRAVDTVVESAIKHFSDAKEPNKKLSKDEFGISFSRLDRKHSTFERGQYQGDTAMYPASVVKLFYLGRVADLVDRKKLEMSEELERGIRDMIVDSNNDATGYVLDVITETTGGPELHGEELKAWMKKRQSVNEWFAGMGYRGMNVCQKTWNEGPYGREKQGYGTKMELRNSLTPNVCNSYMCDIMLDKFVSPSVAGFMKHYLERVVPADGKTDAQSRLFTGKILPKGTKLFSKAGWVESERHDVAGIVLPNGHEYVLAIYTKHHGGDGSVIPYIAAQLLTEMGEKL